MVYSIKIRVTDPGTDFCRKYGKDMDSLWKYCDMRQQVIHSQDFLSGGGFFFRNAQYFILVI